MNAINNDLRILDAKQENGRSSPVSRGNHAATNRFKDVLGSTLDKQIQFSKHANMRLTDRNITLTGDQMARVEGGIVRADEKGIRDSLVLVDNLALVVNVKSRTVITALNRENQNIFSNIDGAVIV